VIRITVRGRGPNGCNRRKGTYQVAFIHGYGAAIADKELTNGLSFLGA